MKKKILLGAFSLVVIALATLVYTNSVNTLATNTLLSNVEALANDEFSHTGCDGTWDIIDHYGVCPGSNKEVLIAHCEEWYCSGYGSGSCYVGSTMKLYNPCDITSNPSYSGTGPILIYCSY